MIDACAFACAHAYLTLSLLRCQYVELRSLVMVTRPAFWPNAYDLTIGDQRHSHGEAAGEFDCVRLSVCRSTSTGTYVERCTHSNGLSTAQLDAQPPILENEYLPLNPDHSSTPRLATTGLSRMWACHYRHQSFLQTTRKSGALIAARGR